MPLLLRHTRRTSSHVKPSGNAESGNSNTPLAETGKDDPLVRCSAVIDEVVAVYDQATWEDYLQFTWVPVGSDYDWKPDTKVKHLYHLSDVRPVTKPFRLPKSARRHGRIWAEYEWGSAL